MDTLSKLLQEAINKRGVSNRAAAQEIGVSHTTISRILKGESVDYDTIILIAKWLGVNASTLMDADSLSEDALANKISALLQTEPQLAEVFEEAADRLAKGQISPDTMRDLVAFASYRLKTVKDETPE
jgi:transcriptional regulator with XRE-family HTH domain